jgi:phosphoribosylformylglycinamidine cyclo-ligase
VAAGGVKAMAHITGGGLVENIPRVLPDGLAAVIDARSWSLPPVFAWLAASVEPAELARTFNCGIGMAVVVSAEEAGALTTILEDAGETVIPMGRISDSEGPGVVIEGMEDAWRS